MPGTLFQRRFHGDPMPRRVCTAHFPLPLSARALLLLMLLLACLQACDSDRKAQPKNARQVTVLTVQPQDIPLTTELSGRVAAFRKAEVRPQLTGILKSRLFTEGALVSKDQSLYKIDPDTYAAELASAKASVHSAEARLEAAVLRRNRTLALLREKAVSQQGYEDANVEYLQAKAQLEVSRAALRMAEIRLQYTDVLAPISGRIGKSSVTQGALVTANQAEPLAVIQQLDPVYVDMTQASIDILQLRENYASGRITQPDSDGARVHILLETGTRYDHEGEIKFSDISVDESTGAVLLRSVFPNPDNILLPGMYVRAIIFKGTAHNAIPVPQRAVQRSPKGEARLFVVKKDNTVEERTVVTAEPAGRCWIIQSGLKAGEKVVVEGLQGLSHGAPVTVQKTITYEDLPQDPSGAKAAQ